MSNDDHAPDASEQVTTQKTTGPDFSLPAFTIDGRTKKGLILAVAVICGIFFSNLSLLLLGIAGILIASGQAPKQVDDFLQGLPLGNHVAKAITQIDRYLS